MMSDKASELLALALTLGRALEHFSSRAADPSVDQEALAREWKKFTEQMAAKLAETNGSNDNERPPTLNDEDEAPLEYEGGEPIEMEGDE